VDIINGASLQSTLAPLSASQSQQIAKHLQEQISSLQTKLGSLGGEMFSDVKDQLQWLREHERKANERFQSMQDEIRAVSQACDNNRNDLGRTSADVTKLRQGLEQAAENIAAMREGQKVNNLALQKLTTDLSTTTDITNNLRHSMEKKIIPDLEQLRDELSKTNLKVRQLSEEGDAQREAIHELKSEVRTSNVSQQRLRDNLDKTNTHVQMLAQRASGLAKTLKEVKQNLEDNVAATQHLSEDQDRLSAAVHDVQGSIWKIETGAAKTQELLDRTQKDLHLTRGQLGSACGILDSTRQGLDQTKAHVRSLRENNEVLSARQVTVAGHLEQTALLASETKRALTHTNNLVLPNLSLEAGAAVYGVPMPLPMSARPYKKKSMVHSSANPEMQSKIGPTAWA